MFNDLLGEITREDDEGMFWGHAGVVSSLNGLDFSNAHAELFG